jgi:glycosyltransferase involved in cell wall biosynthesis
MTELPFLTIFTPTYNRAHTLGQLYASLCQQTFKEFMWLIVDDGSTDETETLVASWISEDKIRIIYHKQANGENSEPIIPVLHCVRPKRSNVLILMTI